MIVQGLVFYSTGDYFYVQNDYAISTTGSLTADELAEREAWNDIMTTREVVDI